MKKRMISLLCVVCVLLSMPGLACAADITPRASDYFSCTDVRAYAEGGGEILIEIDVDATHMMQEVGAEYVFIYEEQSDGDFECVYTFRKTEHPGMVEYNSFFGYVDVTYQGVSGTRYYALVACYAKDKNGAESLYFETNVVTA